MHCSSSERKKKTNPNCGKRNFSEVDEDSPGRRRNLRKEWQNPQRSAGRLVEGRPAMELGQAAAS